MRKIGINPISIYGKQAQFRRSTAWIRGFVGGRGVGKTSIGAQHILLTAKNGEPWMGVSPTAGMIEESTWPVVIEMAKRFGIYIQSRLSPAHKLTFKTQDGGVASLVLRSGDNPDSLPGSSMAGLWFDEASIICHDAFIKGLPVLRHKGRRGQCLMTFTPRGPKHWTFGTFFVKPDSDYADLSQGSKEVCGQIYYPKIDTELVHAHTLDNPFLPDSFYDDIRGNYSTILAEQELGGEFVEIAGLMFKREWFNKQVAVAPRQAFRVRYWDRAVSILEEGCQTAGVLVALDMNGMYYIEDVKCGKWSAKERDDLIHQTAIADATKYGNEVIIVAEQEGGSAGKEISDLFVKRLAGFPVYRDIVSGQRNRKSNKVNVPGQAKITRALPWQAQAEAGNVILVRGSFIDNYLSEILAFPEHKYADQVDATSGAMAWVTKRNQIDPGNITRLDSRVSGERHGIRLKRTK